MHEYSKRIGEHIKAHYSDFGSMNREELSELKDWACVMKDLTEADINIRGIRAMDEAEQEEKMFGRMGYRGRDSRGRFVHRSGRGRSAGYTPYLHMMDENGEYDEMYDYYPEILTGYRMGYTGARNGGNMMGGNSGNNSGNSGNGRYGYDGMEMRRPSRYGESYDRYADHRRHYHDSKDMESKQKMEESMKEYMGDVMENMREMWKDADPALRQTMKADLTKMVQQLQ